MGIVLAYMSLTNILMIRESATWPDTDGTVIEISVQTKTEKNSISYKPHIRYEYVINGKTHDSTAIRFEKYQMIYTEKESQSFVFDHPIGSTIKVHYDPKDPSLSMLNAEFRSNDLLGFVASIIFFLAGSYGIYKVLSGKYKKRL